MIDGETGERTIHTLVKSQDEVGETTGELWTSVDFTSAASEAIFWPAIVEYSAAEFPETVAAATNAAARNHNYIDAHSYPLGCAPDCLEAFL